MKINLTLYFLYLVCLFVSSAMAALNFSRLHTPLKLFAVYVLLVSLGELAALLSERLTGSNVQLYNATDIIQAVMVYQYFASCLKKPIIGIILSVPSSVLGLVSWFHTSDPLNTVFLLWMGLSIIGLSLYTIIDLYKREGQLKLTRFADFWIAAVLLMYWISSLLNLQLFNTMMKLNVDYAIRLNASHIVCNIISFLLIGWVYYRAPKLIQ